MKLGDKNNMTETDKSSKISNRSKCYEKYGLLASMPNAASGGG